MTKKNNQIRLIKKWLENYKHYKKMIRAYQQMLRQDVTIKGVNYDKQKTQATNKFHSDVEVRILRKEDLQERIDSLQSIISKLDISLSALDADERLVLQRFYIDDMSWVAISNQVHVCERQCQRVRDDAIDKMQLLLFAQVEDRKTGNMQLGLDILYD